MTNRPTRALRLAEEAIELAQACDVPLGVVMQLVTTVYSRPKGDVVQELGGVMVTTGVVCYNYGLDMEGVFEQEVRRVLAKAPETFAARNREKTHIS
jgi:NTP pyrophosphatase (non-canonical NTP hydrolase)